MEQNTTQSNNTQPQGNPLIEKSRSAMPGTVFRLPSTGVFYEDTDILRDDVVDGEVLIYPMRLREELAMKAVDSIFQGTAVTDTIRYCCPQILQPGRLVSEDVDYLLTAIKKLTHGDFITYKTPCFDEERRKKHEKQIEKEINDDAESLAKKELDDSSRSEEYTIKDEDDLIKEFNKEVNEEGGEEPETEEIASGICEFQIPLDHFLNTCKPINPEKATEDMVFEFEKFLIRSKPLTFDDLKTISLMRLEEQEKMTSEEFVDFATNFSNQNLAKRILQVDDISDENIIYEWVESLTLDQRTKLYEKLADGVDWGIDFTYTIKCDKCGKTQETDQSYLNPLYFFLMS